MPRPARKHTRQLHAEHQGRARRATTATHPLPHEGKSLHYHLSWVGLVDDDGAAAASSLAEQGFLVLSKGFVILVSFHQGIDGLLRRRLVVLLLTLLHLRHILDLGHCALLSE